MKSTKNLETKPLVQVLVLPLLNIVTVTKTARDKEPISETVIIDQ